jgi:hypothetical protein
MLAVAGALAAIAEKRIKVAKPIVKGAATAAALTAGKNLTILSIV